MSDTDKITVTIPPKDVFCPHAGGLHKWVPRLDGISVEFHFGGKRSLKLSRAEDEIAFELSDVEAAHVAALLTAPHPGAADKSGLGAMETAAHADRYAGFDLELFADALKNVRDFMVGWGKTLAKARAAKV